MTWVQAHLDWKLWEAHGLGNVRGTGPVGTYSKAGTLSRGLRCFSYTSCTLPSMIS
jgi:hypothetical protein